MILTFLYFPMCSKSLKELRNQVFEENEETENKEYRNISLYLVVMILGGKIVGLGVTICIRCVHNYWRYFAKKTFPWVSTQHEHSSPLTFWQGQRPIKNSSFPFSLSLRRYWNWMTFCNKIWLSEIRENKNTRQILLTFWLTSINNFHENMLQIFSSVSFSFKSHYEKSSQNMDSFGVRVFCFSNFWSYCSVTINH